MLQKAPCNFKKLSSGCLHEISRLFPTPAPTDTLPHAREAFKTLIRCPPPANTPTLQPHNHTQTHALKHLQSPSSWSTARATWLAATRRPPPRRRWRRRSRSCSPPERARARRSPRHPHWCAWRGGIEAPSPRPPSRAPPARLSAPAAPPCAPGGLRIRWGTGD